MQTLKAGWSIAWHECLKWFADPKFYLILALLLMTVMEDCRPLNQYVSSSGLALSQWTFPVMFGLTYYNLMINFGVVLLLSNAPFLDHSQISVFMRSGKKIWMFGHVVYIFLACAFYYLCTFFFSILLTLPHLQLSLDWGDALLSASMDYTAGFQVKSLIVTQYSPIMATIHTFLLRTLFGTFTGLVMFIFNFLTSKPVGTLFAVFIIFSVLVPPGSLIGFQPAYLMDLARTFSVRYSYLFFIVVVLILSFISAFIISKKEIEFKES